MNPADPSVSSALRPLHHSFDGHAAGMAAITAMSSAHTLSNIPNFPRNFSTVHVGQAVPETADSIVSPLTPVPALGAPVASFHNDALGSDPRRPHDIMPAGHTIQTDPGSSAQLLTALYSSSGSQAIPEHHGRDAAPYETPAFYSQYAGRGENETRICHVESNSLFVDTSLPPQNTRNSPAEHRLDSPEEILRSSVWPPPQSVTASLSGKHSDMWALPRLSECARKWLFPGRQGFNAYGISDSGVEAFDNIPCPGVMAMFACFAPGCSGPGSEPATIVQRYATVFQAVSAPIEGVTIGYFVTETLVPGTSLTEIYTGRFAHSESLSYLLKISVTAGTGMLRIENNVSSPVGVFLRDLVYASPMDFNVNDGRTSYYMPGAREQHGSVGDLSLTMFDSIPEALHIQSRSMSLFRIRERACPEFPMFDASNEEFGKRAFGMYDYCALPSPAILQGGFRHTPPPVSSDAWGSPGHASICKRPRYIITDMTAQDKTALRNFLHQTVVRELSWPASTVHVHSTLGASSGASDARSLVSGMQGILKVYASATDRSIAYSSPVNAETSEFARSAQASLPVNMLSSSDNVAVYHDKFAVLSAIDSGVEFPRGQSEGRMTTADLMSVKVPSSSVAAMHPVGHSREGIHAPVDFDTDGKMLGDVSQPRDKSSAPVFFGDTSTPSSLPLGVSHQQPFSHIPRQPQQVSAPGVPRFPLAAPLDVSAANVSAILQPMRTVSLTAQTAAMSAVNIPTSVVPTDEAASAKTASTSGGITKRAGRGGRRGTPPSPSDVVMRNRISAQKSNEKRRRRIEASKKELMFLSTVHLPQLRYKEQVLKAENEQLRTAFKVKYDESLVSIQSMF